MPEPLASKAEWERVLDEIRVSLPGASDAGIKGKLYDVLDEFFKDSSAWIEHLNIPILANTQSYEVVAGEEGKLIRLLGVADANGTPQPAMMADFGTVTFRDPYTNPATFDAAFAKTVALPKESGGLPIVPEWVISVYGRVITAGVLGQMMVQPAKSYSNQEVGTYHLKRFNEGVSLARIATLRRNTFGTQAWSFPQNFRTRGQKGGISIGRDNRF